MKTLRAGTRGSELARRQTDIVAQMLSERHGEVAIEPVVIHSHADLHPDELVNEEWPAGAFVAALEQALLRGEIDLAVHSAKDLPAASTAGLIIAAYPPREPANDVIVLATSIANHALTLEAVFADASRAVRLGTGSPRRAMQAASIGCVEIVPIRGNVPTRISRIGDGVDGVILAAAGLLRLGLLKPGDINAEHPATLELHGRRYTVFTLRLERYPTSPGQGAMAVQTRRENSQLITMLGTIDDETTRRAVATEKSFLAAMSAGCLTPLAAYATVNASGVSLHAQMAHRPGGAILDVRVQGDEPHTLGARAAAQLLSMMESP
jgi:hydroxymethylbilane synthase